MKVVFGYPPLASKKGIPLLGQNRQFQWVHSPWTAYPMIPAYAATMLKENSYQVYWLDGINSNQTYSRWQNDLRKINPDILLLETKTPVIKKHWQIINKIKKQKLKIKIILVGDHVTAMPEESFKNSQVDYVITGGDYDFLLLNLLNHLTKKEKLEPGILYRKNAKIKNQKSKLKIEDKKIITTGKFKLNHNLNTLPFIDRDLTRWQLYAYNNSNYLRLPGTYTMFARDCWWGRCTFCSWTILYPQWRVIQPQRALDEIGQLIEKYQIKEIMDDSGTFPVGEWLKEFCQGMIKKGYAKKIHINCNMRLNAGLTPQDYQLMAKAGFRLILYGLESSNQKTLDKLNKNLKIETVEKNLSLAKQAGLKPHLTVMIGYPWETKQDILNTLNFVKKLFKNNLIDSLQATLVIPYPGTPLFKEAKKNGWLKTEDWNKYDMQQSVLHTPLTDEELKKIIQDFYKSIFSLSFLIRKAQEALTDLDVFSYYLRLGLKLPSKLLDFSEKK